jgi:hypothetical protein
VGDRWEVRELAGVSDDGPVFQVWDRMSDRALKYAEYWDRASAQARIDRMDPLDFCTACGEPLWLAGRFPDCPAYEKHRYPALSDYQYVSRVRAQNTVPGQELIADCLEPYDHDRHVWQSKSGARRCPGGGVSDVS